LFANRFTALADACSLAGALKRNLLLTLAEADFYRLRWSSKILDETEQAIIEILTKKDATDPKGHAAYARSQMELAFGDATVDDYELFLPSIQNLPDPGDAHVVAAALKTRAHVIVTDNLRDFPLDVLKPLGLSAVSTDDFLANTIALNEAAAINVIRKMRESFQRPEMNAKALLLKIEAAELPATANLLKDFVELL
jgi:hypothetical protein